MHLQLQEIVDDFEAARRRLHALAASVPAEMWTKRPAADRWSIGECVAHVNLTSDAYRPIVIGALERARSLPGSPPLRYRRDPLGWFLWKIMPPPVRMKVKTLPPFAPTATDAPAVLIAKFDDLQDQQIGWVRRAEGLRLSDVKIASPFSPRARYNLFACLGILPRHQHRHLWQAEQASQTLRT